MCQVPSYPFISLPYMLEDEKHRCILYYYSMPSMLVQITSTFFFSRYIWFLFVDSSGMDFRSMLKKKKYAKWGNDDEGLYRYAAH